MSEADKPNNEKNEQAPGNAAATAAPTATTDKAAPPGGARPGAGKAAQGSSGKGLAVLALLVGLAGAGVGVYSLLQQQRQADQVEQRLAQQLGDLQRLPAQVETLDAGTHQVQQRLQALEQLPSAQTLEERGRLLASLQGQQQQLQERVDKVLGASREQWRLAEAEHLLRLAMLRLSAMQDVNSAIALLAEADLILQKQDDPGAYAARQALMQGLEALRSLPELDRTGLFLQLAALRNQTAQVVALAPQFQTGDAVPEQADAPLWQRWLDELSRYVRLELDSDTQVKPLLAGQSLGRVRLALSLAIEQAQWAVLNGNAEVYRQSLAQAVSLLDSQFSSDNQQSQALQQRLQQLAGRQVALELPELTPALRALQRYIDERESAASGDDAPARSTAPADEEAAPAASGEATRA